MSTQIKTKELKRALVLHRRELIVVNGISIFKIFIKMKTLFSILFYLAAGLYVCLSYLLVHMIGTDGNFGLIILDLVGLFFSIILINFLIRKYIN